MVSGSSWKSFSRRARFRDDHNRHSAASSISRAGWAATRYEQTKRDKYQTRAEWFPSLEEAILAKSI
jgi:hypothetical protein